MEAEQMERGKMRGKRFKQKRKLCVSVKYRMTHSIRGHGMLTIDICYLLPLPKPQESSRKENIFRNFHGQRENIVDKRCEQI